MSYRHWLPVVAFGGFLTISSWAVLAQEQVPPVTKSQSVPESREKPTTAGNGKRETESESPENVTPALNKIESAIRDLVEQERTGRGQRPSDEEIRDLIAQEGMALWAERMFWATLAAVILTLVGVFLICRTLSETRRAANYTKGMLREARKTTKAAEETIAVTREIGQKQIRAYITITEVWAHLAEDNTICLRIEISNTGASPTKRLEIAIKATCCQFEHWRDDVPSEMGRTTFNTDDIPAGGGNTVEKNIRVPGSTINPVLENIMQESAYLAEITVKFIDVFDDKQGDTFCFRGFKPENHGLADEIRLDPQWPAPRINDGG
ncbi:MAG: hypothetical protein WD075_03875 [Rhodospirillales bacterium]